MPCSVAVGDALSSGMEDMQALEDRLAADVEQKAEELEALSRCVQSSVPLVTSATCSSRCLCWNSEQELAIHKLTEDLAAMTNELEDCEQQRQVSATVRALRRGRQAPWHLTNSVMRSCTEGIGAAQR